jgi:hypothetical protein
MNGLIKNSEHKPTYQTYQIKNRRFNKMKSYKTLFLAFAVLALALSAALPAVDVGAASLPSADTNLATVTRVSLVGVENRTATIRVSGTYFCEKVNIVQKVEDSIITLEAQEAGSKKSCGTQPKIFVRDVKVKALMPGSSYTVVVNDIQRLTGVSISSSAPGGTTPASEAKPKETAEKLATVRKATLVSTEPYGATFHLVGTYSCDKVRITGEVVGKTIYINIWDTKNRGNNCEELDGGSYSRWVTFKPLVPGRYTVMVNTDPETGETARRIKDVIIPVGEATPTEK